MIVKSKNGNAKDSTYNYDHTFQVLNPFLNVFSLNCGKYQTEKFTFKSLMFLCLPVAILGCLNVVTFYFKIIHTYKDMLISIKYTDAIQVLYDYCQYIVDIYNVYKNGKHLKRYHTRYGDIDNLVSFTYWSVLNVKLFRLVIFFGISWTLTCICDYCAWSYAVGLETASLFSISYIYILIKILTSLDMTSHVMQIEYRLRNIGDITESWLKNYEPLKAQGKVKTWFPSDALTNALEEMNGVEDNLPKISMLSKSYVWLLEQVHYINRVFGTRILLNSLSLLIDMVRFTNIAFRILLGSQHLKTLGIFLMISTIMRLLMCFILLFSMAKHCEMAYKQQNKIIYIIDKILVLSQPNGDLKSSFTDFRGLVQARPVDFHMSNYIRLDYSLLCSIVSIVVTYTIILLQSVN